MVGHPGHLDSLCISAGEVAVLCTMLMAIVCEDDFSKLYNLFQCLVYYNYCTDCYYYNHFTAPWTLSGTTQVSRYQQGKKQEGINQSGLLEQEIVSGIGIS